MLKSGQGPSLHWTKQAFSTLEHEVREREVKTDPKSMKESGSDCKSTQIPDPVANTSITCTCLDLKTPLLCPVINQSVEWRSGFCLTNHGIVYKEPISNPQMVTSTDVTFSKSKRDAFDQPIIRLYISKDNQWQDTRKGVLHKKVGLESSRRMFSRNMNSAIRSGSRTDILKPFPM